MCKTRHWTESTTSHTEPVTTTSYIYLDGVKKNSTWVNSPKSSLTQIQKRFENRRDNGKNTLKNCDV